MSEVVIRKGAVDELPALLEREGFAKVLLVRGDKSYQQTRLATVISDLPGSVTIREFFGFERNPNIRDTERALVENADFTPDVILAAGGGSVIDMAKSIAVGMAIGFDRMYSAITSGERVDEEIVPLIAVPTTSGTGSEATSFAVTYLDGIKYSLAGNEILPPFAIVDPELTYQVPAKITADTGLDALSQAMESFWSVKSSEESRAFAGEALELAAVNLEKAVEGDPEARDAMAKASNLAGRAINLTTTTAPHATSYPLTILHGLPHGHAVAMTLVEYLVINSPGGDFSRGALNEALDGAEYSERMQSLYAKLGTNSAEEAAAFLYRLFDRVGIESDMKAFCGDEQEFAQILSGVNAQRLGNNPKCLAPDDLKVALRQPFRNSLDWA